MLSGFPPQVSTGIATGGRAPELPADDEPAPEVVPELEGFPVPDAPAVDAPPADALTAVPPAPADSVAPPLPARTDRCSEQADRPSCSNTAKLAHDALRPSKPMSRD